MSLACLRARNYVLSRKEWGNFVQLVEVRVKVGRT